MKFCTNNVSTSTSTSLVISSSQTLSGIIPKGYKMLDVVVYNREAFPVTVTLSSTVGGGEFLFNEIIPASGWVDVDAGRILSFTNASDIYFSCPEVLSNGINIVITSRFSLAL